MQYNMIVNTPKLLDQLTPDQSIMKQQSEKHSARDKKNALVSKINTRNNSKLNSGTATS